MLYLLPMRLVVVICALAACQGVFDPTKMLDNGSGSGGGSGSGSATIAECMVDSDCVLEGVKCCDCPSYAEPKSTPGALACDTVPCPPSSCPNNVRAACDQNFQCTIACLPMACSSSCAAGYEIDASGCLECTCAAVNSRSCTSDSDCVRVRADCCGCTRGGSDTAVLASDAAGFDASLMCPTNPQCPGGDTCAPDLAPKCIEGACELVEPLPAGACGRSDLPACPSGQSCVINANPDATKQGVGVCM